MKTFHRDHPQKGAALLMALVILAALLMLGLPFIFSQSLSRSGSLSFRSAQESKIARDSAIDLGKALAEQATQDALSNGRKLYSMLDRDIETFLNLPPNKTVPLTVDERLANTVHIDVKMLAGYKKTVDPTWKDLVGEDEGSTLLGVSITDESGKFDINTMTATHWASLLSATGVGGNAKNLADHRFFNYNLTPPLPQLYTSIYDLTEELETTDQTIAAPLTIEQVASLRPYISAHNHSQGRDGLTDLGLLVGQRKLIRVIANAGLENVTIAGEYRLRIEVGGQAWQRRQNLDIGDDWTNNFTREFSVNDLDATVNVYLFSPPSNTRTTVNPVNVVRRFHLELDGPIDGEVIPDEVIVLQTENGDEVRFRAPSSTKSPESSIYWIYNEERLIERNINNFTRIFPPFSLSGSSLIRVRKEAPAPVNIHHAPSLVREVALDSFSTTHGIAEDGGYFPFNTWLSNPGLNDDASRNLWNELGPHRIAEPNTPVQTRTFQYPIGFRSYGTYDFHGRSSIGDKRDRPKTQNSIKQKSQVGGEIARKINSQSDWEMLTRYGLTNQISSWPNAIRRIGDLLPDETWDTTNYSTPSNRPTLADYATNSNIPVPSNISVTWSRNFRGETDGGHLGSPLTSTVTETTPEGIELTNGISYQVNDTATTPFSQNGDMQELNGFHWNMWIKPESKFNDGQTLLEMRTATGYLGNTIDGVSGDNDLQNILRLHWDQRGYLVLTINGPTIEHNSDISRSDGTVDRIVPDITGDNSLTVNEESLGYYEGGNHRPLAPKTPTQGHGVQHWHYLGDSFFQTEQWYNLQIAVSHNRPGGQSIIVDGVAGRDVSNTPGAGIPKRGDHITLPTMLLETPLPREIINDASGGQALTMPSTISLLKSAIHEHLNLDADDLFPSSGTVLIGNEFIQYNDIVDNELIDIVRSSRTNTNTTSPNPNQRWPLTQEHLENATVMPGSYRWRPSGGPLYRGETHTLHALANGDNRPTSPLPWVLWGTSNNPSDHDNVAPDAPAANRDHSHPFGPSSEQHIWVIHEDNVTEEIDGSDVTMSANTELPLDSIYKSVSDEFPVDGGIIAISKNATIDDNDVFFHYSRFEEDTFKGLTPFEHPRHGSSNQIRWNSESDEIPYVMLISLRVELDDEPYQNITEASFFDQSDRSLFQIDNSTTGRIEWITYTGTVQQTFSIDGANELRQYFLSDDAWGEDARGQQRTAFAGTYQAETGDSLLTSRDIFETNSRILPVQNSLGNSFRINTGDVITIMPIMFDFAQPESTPRQMVIRFAATDGYHENGSTPEAIARSDTNNEWFSFTERVVPNFATDNIEFITGNAWSGHDLSTVNPSQFKAGFMPRLSILAAGGSSGIFIGSGDHTQGGGNGTGISIDGLAQGNQPGSTVNSVRRAQITGFTDLSGSSINRIGSGFDALGTEITVDPASTLNSSAVLVRIGGEVMAVEDRRIIARGLLGSQRQEHILSARSLLGNGTAYDGIPIIRLPIGPVYNIEMPLHPMETGLLPRLPTNPTETWLITSPDGSRSEFLMAPNDRVKPWLRGLWGSQVINWPADAGTTGAPSGFTPRNIAIAWSPRYPSPIPKHFSGTNRDKAFLSKAFPWVSIPLRKRNLFDSSVKGWPVGAGNANWNIEGRWYASDDAYTPTTNLDGARPWENLNGVEFKAHWLDSRSGQTDFLTLTETLNISPVSLDSFEIRADSPTVIFERIEAR